MSRPGLPAAGLLALAAAVADERRAPRPCALRARPGPHPLDGSPWAAARATDRSGRLAPGTTVPAGAPEPPGPRVPQDSLDGDPGPGTGPLALDVPAPTGDLADGLELVRRCQAGDAEAFGLLYDRYADTVHRYLAYRVGSPQLAEDLTSETFLRALRSIGGWQWRGRDVGAWLVTIARNLVADHYKSSRYRLEVSTGDVTGLPVVPVTEGPETAVLAGLDAEVVLQAVRRLRPEQQECVALRFLQGLSVAETAEIMGRSEGAVKALQHRAVKALARLLPVPDRP